MPVESHAAPARVLVWDLSVRTLHAVLGVGAAAALALGSGLEDEHPWFAAHVAAGLMAGGALVLRVLLGVLGPRHLRFSLWPLSPGQLLRWLPSLARGREEGADWAGHNPGASWVMLGMLAAVGALLLTGWAGLEDLHEGLAGVLAALIGLHLLGLLLHTLRTRENIARSMLDGRKRAPGTAALAAPGWARGLLTAAVLALWAGWLWQGTDLAAGTVRLAGWEFRADNSDDHRAGRHREDHDDD